MVLCAVVVCLWVCCLVFRSDSLVIVNSVAGGAVRIHCLLVFVGMF